MRTRVVAVALVVVGGSLLVSCGGGGEKASRATGPTSTVTASAVTTTPSTSSGATTSSPCAPFGSIADQRVDYPDTISSLVGKAVRTGTHPCYERFVVELQPSNQPTSSRFPGYWVRYATGPVTLNPKGEAITLGGSAVLLVSMGSWMLNTENDGYKGQTDVRPANVAAIREYRLTEDFEGQSTWALGVDKVRNFRATVLESPPRLVVDLAT